jgi:hypothetical protein
LIETPGLINNFSNWKVENNFGLKGRVSDKTIILLKIIKTNKVGFSAK